ncbi:MAG: esterase family protein [Porphyromonadaceae bacterium]|nr:esterase family protein [Porphyromonadaceae bacterium]
MKSKLLILSLCIVVFFVSCEVKKTDGDKTKSVLMDLVTTSPQAFYHSILKAFDNTEEANKPELADSIYKIAKQNQWIPIVFADTAVFIYKGSSEGLSVKIAGDMTAWNPSISLSSVGGTSLYLGVYKAPSKETRVDYKIVINSKDWILDPGNPKKQMSGFGYNSELALSEYVYSDWIKERNDGQKGTLSGNILIASEALGYDVNYKIYLPAGYDSSKIYPLLVTTDGHEYSSKEMGSLTIVADNMINDNKIDPVIIVFVDPRDPKNHASNRRMIEYAGNDKFAVFLAEELMSELKANYSIAGTPDQTAILGTSMGGLISAFIGISYPHVYGLVAIQSPAFKHWTAIYSYYETSPAVDLKIYMDTGVIQDTQEAALKMKGILDKKGYVLHYAEYFEGHSWGSWRARMDEVLEYFFGK